MLFFINYYHILLYLYFMLLSEVREQRKKKKEKRKKKKRRKKKGKKWVPLEFRVVERASHEVASERDVKEKLRKLGLLEKTNQPKFRLYKSHQSLVGAAIQTKPPSVDWPGI